MPNYRSRAGGAASPPPPATHGTPPPAATQPVNNQSWIPTNWSGKKWTKLVGSLVLLVLLGFWFFRGGSPTPSPQAPVIASVPELERKEMDFSVTAKPGEWSEKRRIPRAMFVDWKATRMDARYKMRVSSSEYSFTPEKSDTVDRPIDEVSFMSISNRPEEIEVKVRFPK